MENKPTRPLCSICNKRQVDTFKTSQGLAFRKNCSTCRRDPHHEEKRYKKALASREGAVDHVRPLCKTCGRNLASLQSTRFGLKADGTPYYHSNCGSCRKHIRIANGGKGVYWAGYRKEALKARGPNPICEHCGFIPVHIGQLDVDHIDGNHQNHDPDNLQVICSNCHRLKTIRCQDQLTGSVRGAKSRWDEYREHATKPNPLIPIA